MKTRGVQLYLYGADSSVLSFKRVEPAPDRQKATHELIICSAQEGAPERKCHQGSISSRTKDLIEDTMVVVVDGVVYVALHDFELHGEPRPGHHSELQDDDGEMTMGEEIDFNDPEGEPYEDAIRLYVRPLGIAGRAEVKVRDGYTSLEDKKVPAYDLLSGKITDTVLAIKNQVETAVLAGDPIDEGALPILADALQDTGFDCDEVLDDLRAGGLTGAWVIPWISDAQASLALSAFIPAEAPPKKKKGAAK